MAIAALHRFSSQISRSPSISQFIRSTATYAAPSSSSSSQSKKVSDRIVKIFAIDLDGQKREIRGLTGTTLLKALTNTGLIDPASHRLEEIDACSAECEVMIAEEWLEKLPPRHSRLGCQVVLSQELQGMVVAVPEPKPWDIP
ncbi:hypothetical protein Sjap_009391 [Stephania japonica]|uniref:Ferredoxin n=1 Tax=Stephania japonica TaxID=461633 RepID=A0AAP0JTQ5_9MAGN